MVFTGEHKTRTKGATQLCVLTYCPLCALLLSVMDKSTATGRDPADVAQAVLKAVRHRSKDVVLAGAVPTLAVYLRTLWPALFFKVMSSRARKEQKHKNE